QQCRRGSWRRLYSTPLLRAARRRLDAADLEQVESEALDLLEHLMQVVLVAHGSAQNRLPGLDARLEAGEALRDAVTETPADPDLVERRSHGWRNAAVRGEVASPGRDGDPQGRRDSRFLRERDCDRRHERSRTVTMSRDSSYGAIEGAGWIAFAGI